jgi:enoyl-CoA hydratase
VNKVLPPEDLYAKTLETAKLIAEKGPLAVGYAKRVIGEGLDNVLSDGNALEIDAFAKCFESQDQREGMAAFIEKRPPQFRGI